ncbi:MAG: hypothetical protein WDM70_04400 [Nitrosomonadales bacterium]
MISATQIARADDAPQKGDSVQMMEAFDRNAPRVEDANVLSDHKKHVVMFLMGVPLLILILITGALGIAMVVFGKQVFMMHMIFAGLTVTLALAHVVTGLVWFYPF